MSATNTKMTEDKSAAISGWHAHEAEFVAEALASPQSGLSSAEAAARLKNLWRQCVGGRKAALFPIAHALSVSQPAPLSDDGRGIAHGLPESGWMPQRYGVP